MSCAYHDRGSAELYFYGELDEPSREAFVAHLDGCAICRDALADLETIRQALASRRESAAPAGGNWDAFMRGLDARLGEEPAPRAPRAWNWGLTLKIAATVAIATAGVLGGFQWQRARIERGGAPAASLAAVAREASPTPFEALTTVTDRHLERSKLVLLGLSAKDPRVARPSDWTYERELASSLIADTTQYRLAAADQGRPDLVKVLGDLETVLLQASLGDDEDPRALERLQRLIARRDLLTKIEVMNSEGSARRASTAGAAGRGYEGRSRGNE
jgi:hypothetical protein